MERGTVVGGGLVAVSLLLALALNGSARREREAAAIEPTPTERAAPPSESASNTAALSPELTCAATHEPAKAHCRQ